MRNVGRRVRGVVVTGLAWGAAWGAAGGGPARLAGFESDLPLAFLFAPFGVVTGVVFAAVLAAIAGRRGLDRVSLARAAGCGAVSGLVPAVVVTVLRGEASEVLVFGPLLALAGVACAAASLAAARRAAASPTRA